jgi:hypothetical protein
MGETIRAAPRLDVAHGQWRVIVCGARDYRDGAMVYRALDYLHRERGLALVIHGDAGRTCRETGKVLEGADRFAGEWAWARGVAFSRWPADWGLGKRAGPERNQRMLDRGQPHAVVAFPGGPGTQDMVDRALDAGLPVWHPVRRRPLVPQRTGDLLAGVQRGAA